MNNKEAAIEHLKKYRGVYSCYCFEEDGYLTRQSKYQCYAPLRNKATKGMSFLGAGFYCEKIHEAGVEFFKWVTGPTSPWKSLLLEPVEPVEDDTYIYGFILGPKTLAKADNQFLMSFLIASRNWNEFNPHILFWWKIIKEFNVPPHIAYIYARDMSIYGQDIYVQSLENSNHWSFLGDIDIDRVLDSEPNYGTQINKLFSKTNNGSHYEAEVDTTVRYMKYANASNIISLKKFEELHKEESKKYVPSKLR